MSKPSLTVHLTQKKFPRFQLHRHSSETVRPAVATAQAAFPPTPTYRVLNPGKGRGPEPREEPSFSEPAGHRRTLSSKLIQWAHYAFPFPGTAWLERELEEMGKGNRNMLSSSKLGTLLPYETN